MNNVLDLRNAAISSSPSSALQGRHSISSIPQGNTFQCLSLTTTIEKQGIKKKSNDTRTFRYENNKKRRKNSTQNCVPQTPYNPVNTPVLSLLVNDQQNIKPEF